MNNSEMTKRIDIALDIQQKLTQFVGVKPVIAGGAARDVYYGAVPKDFDIIFPMEVNPKDLNGFFVSLGVVSPRFIPMYHDSSCDRIRGVMKINHEGLDFDIIFYAVAEDECITDYFDFNFNQFELQGRTSVFRGDKEHWDKENGGLIRLIQTRYDASPKRISYITDKWMQYQQTRVNGLSMLPKLNNDGVWEFMHVDEMFDPYVEF